MKSEKLLYSIGKIREDIIEEAAPKATSYSSHVKKIISFKQTKRVLLVVAIIIAMLLMAAATYAIIRHYSTPIENTKLYYYTDDGHILNSEKSKIDSPEKAAYELAVLYMEDLRIEDESRTFRITEYKDLKVEVIPTTQMDEETAAIYFLKDEEISNTTWIVEISVSYKYEGTLSPIGPSNNEWIDILYQGSPIGFLMTQEGNSFTLKSRYQ
jgi:hypothetical protein